MEQPIHESHQPPVRADRTESDASVACSSAPATRAGSVKSRQGVGRANAYAASETASRAAIAVKQSQLEHAQMQSQLQTSKALFAEADGGRVQALKALAEAWKRIDALEQGVAAARAEEVAAKTTIARQMREMDSLSHRHQALEAELAEAEAHRVVEAADGRQFLHEIDGLQERLAEAQEEAKMGHTSGTVMAALHAARRAALAAQAHAAAMEDRALAASAAEEDAAAARSQLEWLQHQLQGGEEALQQELRDTREDAAAARAAAEAARLEAAVKEEIHQETLDTMQDQLEHFQELAQIEQMRAYDEVQQWVATAQAAQRELLQAGRPHHHAAASPLNLAMNTMTVTAAGS